MKRYITGIHASYFSTLKRDFFVTVRPLLSVARRLTELDYVLEKVY